jgi:hypothetical protein
MAGAAQLDLVHKAICSRVLGHIQWKDAAARRMRDDRGLEGLTLRGIRAVLRQFVLDGHSLQARRETRAEFLEERPNDPYWYRALLPIPGLPGELFVEVVLADDDPEEPWVEIVSVHQQKS